MKFKFPHIKAPKLPALPKLQISALPKLTFPQFNLPKLHAITWPTWRIPRPGLITIRRITLTSLIGFCALLMINSSTQTQSSRKAWASINPTVEFDLALNLDAKPPANAVKFNAITPASGTTEETYRYTIEKDPLTVETVLIPHSTTVISSSRDSKIKSVNFDNGQLFKKGDILVEYTCDDVQADVEIAKTQQKLSDIKNSTSNELFKLDIISNIERLELETESKQAQARATLHKSRIDQCFIRAEYDGRVVKRLANAGEFTRTDRVLMEVASLDYLKAEFLLPSRWLRWINIGAPIEISINETDETYEAKISHIYGEIDPASQSIQITAQLAAYDAVLLPDMSGQTTLNAQAIRNAGITGFLERPANK